MRNNNILLGDLVKASQKNLLGDRDDSDAHTGVLTHVLGLVV
jgi:hypothetical protein